MAQKDKKTRAAITQSDTELKGLSEAISTKSLGRNEVTKTRPGCCVLFKMAATMFEFWASLETNVMRKTCTLEDETSVSG